MFRVIYLYKLLLGENLFWEIKSEYSTYYLLVNYKIVNDANIMGSLAWQVELSTVLEGSRPYTRMDFQYCILGNLSGGESTMLCVRDLYVTLDK